MASNQLSPGVVKEIRAAIAQLMGRAVFFNPCPLKTKGDMRRFWHATFDQEIVKAWETLSQHDYELYSCSTALITFRCGNKTVNLHVDTAADDGTNNWVLMQPPHKSHHIALTDKMFVGTGTNWQEFKDWMEVCHEMHIQIEDGLAVFDQIAQIANTPGQLARLMPESMQYMPDYVKKHVGSRQSALPPSAQEVDHLRVIGLANTLAKCYLMPATPERGAYEFETLIADHSWVTPTKD